MQSEGEFTNRQLFALFVPLILEQLLAITVGLVDSVMVASVGETAVSAVSLVDSVSNLIINIFAALATGGAVVAGQYLGKRERKKACRAGWNLLVLLVSVSLVLTVLIYGLKDFWIDILFSGITPEVRRDTDTYYSIVMASVPFVAIYSGGAALFRTMQKSSVTMKISTAVNLFNVAGNGILIYGFHMGVEGAAIPTLFSRMFSAVWILVLLMNPEQEISLRSGADRRVSGKLTCDILEIGIPGGVENVMFHFGRLVLTSIVAGMGTASIVANAVGNVVGGFHIFAAQSMGLGMVTVASKCIGAGSYEAARFYTKKLMKAMIAVQIAVNAVLIAVTPFIISAYKLAGEAADLTVKVTVLHGLCSMVLYPLAFGFCNVFRAAGDAKFTMTVASTTMWTGRILAGYLLGVVFGYGIVGVWFAQVILDWGMRSAVFTARYMGKKWERTLID